MRRHRSSRHLRLGACRIGVVLAMSLCGRPTAAQAPAPPDEARGLRLGPVVVRPGVEVGRAGVDSNILRQAGNGIRDRVAAAGAHLDAEMRVRPFSFQTANSVGYDYFARHSDQRSLNRAHLLRVELPMNRVSVFASGSFLTARDRFNFDLESRVRRTEHGVSAGAQVRLGAKTAVGAELRRSDLSFGGSALIDGIPVRALMQQRRHVGSALVRYDLTRLTTVSVRADADEARFTHSPERNSKTLRVMPTVELHPFALVSGRAAVGYESFKPAGAGFPRFSGVVGAADLMLPLPGDLRLRLGASRDLEYSFQVAEPLYLLTGTTVGLSRRLGDRWAAEIATARQRLGYLSVAGSPEQGLLREARADRRIAYQAALRYQVTSLLRVSLESEYARRRSPLGSRGFEQFQAGFSFSYGFPR